MHSPPRGVTSPPVVAKEEREESAKKHDNFVSQKTIHFTFDHNFGKCRPICKIRPLSDSRGKFVLIY